MKEGAWRISTNLHASSEWQVHVVEFDENHDLVTHLEMGDFVVVYAQARYVLYPLNFITTC